MSGLEIAGIVLGAFPVVVTGLKAYTEILKDFKRAWQVQLLFKTYLNTLKSTRLHFAYICLEVYQGGYTEEEAASLINNPSNFAWDYDKVKKHRKSKLKGEELEIYRSHTAEIVRIMQDIENKLDPWLKDPDPKEGWHTQSKMRKKVYGLLSANEFKSLFNELQDQCRSTGELLQARSRIKPLLEVLGVDKKTGAIYRQIQKQSERLLRLLCSTRLWSCGCHAPNVAHLRLSRLLDGHVDAYDAAQDPMVSFGSKLSVLLTFRGTIQGCEALESEGWRELDFLEASKVVDSEIGPGTKLLENDPNSSRPLINVSRSAVSLEDSCLGSQYSAESDKERKSAVSLGEESKKPFYSISALKEKYRKSTEGRGVRFASTITFTMDNDASRTTVETTLTTKLAKHFTNISAPPLNSICSALLNSIPPDVGKDTQLGYFDDEDNQIQHHVHEASCALCKATPGTKSSPQISFVSLHQLLSSPEAAGMHLDIRLQLCLILATTTLQLHGTMWQNETWRSKDVLFPSFQDRIWIARPFISRTMTDGDSHVCSSSPPVGFIRNYSLLSLAIVLTELGLGKTLSELQTSVRGFQGNTESTFTTEAATVAELLHTGRPIPCNLGIEFTDAVHRCLFVHFGLDSWETSLESDNLVAAVHTYVVEKLENQTARFSKLDINAWIPHSNILVDSEPSVLDCSYK